MAKKPELYNDGNLAYAQDKAGYADYISGKTNDLGSFNYTPYVDYKKTTMERALKFKELKGDEEVETIVNDEQGRPTIKKKVKVSGLTTEEVLQYFPEVLTAQEEKQMAIDGYNMLKGAKPEELKRIADEYLTGIKSEIKDKIKESDAIINGNFPQDIKDQAARVKKQYEQNIKYTEKRESSINKADAESVGYMLKRGEFMDMAKGLFTGRESTTYEPNEMYFKMEDLEIKREEQLQKRAEHAAKMKKEYGVDVNGAPIEEGGSGAFVASPEVNQEYEDQDIYKAVREEHDKAYNTVVNTVEEAYRDKTVSDSEKLLLEKELKKTGFAFKNGKVESIVKGNKNSKAKSVAQAFLNSGIGNSNNGYEKKISQAEEIRSYLSSGLKKAEKDFDKEFNTDKFAEDFQDASGKLKRWSPARLLDFTENAGIIGAIFDPITRPFRENEKGNTPEEQKRLDISSKIDATIKKYGGVDGLKTALKGNRSLAVEMNTLLKEAASADANIVVGMDFKNAEKSVSAMGQALKKENVMNYVPSKNTINVTTEDARTSLIGLLPQQTRDMEGNLVSTGVANFDPKKAVTVEKGADYYDVIQDQGTKTDSKGQTISVPTQTTRVYKGSAAYNYIESNTQEKEFKLDARQVNDDYKISATVRPKFLNPAKDSILMEHVKGKFEKEINQEVRTALEYGTSRKLPIDPMVYFDKEKTKSVINYVLQGKVKPEQVDALMNRLESNITKYKVDLVPNKGNANGVPNWAIKFQSPFDTTPVIMNFNNDPELNSDFSYLIKNMPQIMIMSEVIKFLEKNPGEIDNI